MDVSGEILPEIAQKHNVGLIPMEFIIDGKPTVYTDDENGFDAVSFFDMVKTNKVIKTSQINPAFFENYFGPYLEKGISCLYLSLSSSLSSTYSSAMLAKDNLQKKYSQAKLLVIDSLTATTGMGLILEQMILNKENGMDIDENFQCIEKSKMNVNTSGVVDNLVSLKRSGRISSGAAFLGGLLKIKPLLEVTQEGKIELFEKQRGFKSALQRIAEIYKKTHDIGYNLVYISHANELANAESLANMVRNINPSCQVRIRMMSPIIGAHLGPGSVAIGYFSRKGNE